MNKKSLASASATGGSFGGGSAAKQHFRKAGGYIINKQKTIDAGYFKVG
jgi:hypothetical protein